MTKDPITSNKVCYLEVHLPNKKATELMTALTIIADAFNDLPGLSPSEKQLLIELTNSLESSQDD